MKDERAEITEAAQPAQKTESAPVQAADNATADDEPAEVLELVEIAEGVAVVGDSRTTYCNRKAIKAHGARWNKAAQQWQASEPEAVARLREWFGVSGTPTAEEADSTTDSTTAQTGADATLCEAGEITAIALAPTEDRPTLLRYVAAGLRQSSRSKNPLDALRARLYALYVLGVGVYDLMTLAASIPPESVGGRSATSCALETIQRLSGTADRRATEVLTPEEWQTLFDTPHPKQHTAA